jgi:branched-chain amino acid aminotransferase
VRLDRHWIPQQPGYSLYVRPTLSRSFLDWLPTYINYESVGAQQALGVGPPDEALLFVICSPVGPYYAGGFKPVALYGTTEYVRAFEGGQ